MINYCSLLKIKYQTFFLCVVVAGLFVITFILSFILKTYDTYHTLGIYQDELVVSIPLENSDAVNNGYYLTINNQDYKYQINKVSEMQAINYNNYQDYYLNINKTFQQNEVVEITFYYNKEKLIEKIMKIIF